MPKRLSMIQPDADGQIEVRLPAFVDDPEAYLREDTQSLRQHLERMDAQAYGMLIWRVLQADILSHVKLLDEDDRILPGSTVQIEFEAHPSCTLDVAQCVAKNLEDTLNSLQSDAVSTFIKRLKHAGSITRDTADTVIGEAYDYAFDGTGAPKWKEARSLQESIRIREHTTSIDPLPRPRRRI